WIILFKSPSLHDALPIFLAGRGAATAENLKRKARRLPISICIPDYKKKNDLKKRFKLSIKHAYKKPNGNHKTTSCSNSKCDSARSEEHTSELQSRENLVC